ncbi:phage DNA ejection protein [Yersinia kristensenii]|uniref:phage DNA ejection protein n=1 Tax=Yersinia kristensenii TaxID=28152 RepID=UPI0015624268|nr:phage DNA ejection protein [Yersinia kristensenii]QKJ17297.1 phage DNA ejection protein [Yersinia kristensenii]
MAGEYQPIDYSSGNGFLQGLQGAGLYQQVQQQRAQADQAKQQQAAQQAFQQDWQKAYSSGDPQQLDAIIAKYPGQMEIVQKAIGFRDDNHRMALGNTARDLRVAMQSGNPDAIAQAAQRNASALESIGSSPQEFMQMYQQDPRGAMQTVDTVGMGALGVKDYYEVQNDQQQRQIDRDKLSETVRSNQAGEGLQARGQNITLRGQDISAQNSQRSAGGSVPSSVREYEYVKNLSPDERKEFLKLTKGGKSSDLQSAQLSSGETVMIDPNPLGAGSTKFYKGYDADGKVITVPVSSLSTSIDSSGSATQGQMNSDIDLILKSNPRETGPLTGITGSTGRPAITADVGSRISDPKTREIFNAANRIQGNMQNQGVAAARSMGASGINTVAEAKMYFQSMPQIDYSSRNSLIKSMENVKKYTDEHNSVNKVNYSNQQQPSTQQPASGGGFSNLWGG